jgi:hypothetical protein
VQTSVPETNALNSPPAEIEGPNWTVRGGNIGHAHATAWRANGTEALDYNNPSTRSWSASGSTANQPLRIQVTAQQPYATSAGTRPCESNLRRRRIDVGCGVQYVQWLDELDRTSVPVAGGKGANLGEMMRAGLPVPPRFVVTVDAWNRLAGEAHLAVTVVQRVDSLNVEDSRQLETAAMDIERLIDDSPIPADVSAMVTRAYRELCRRKNTTAEFVAVRSSGTVEDAADTPSLACSGATSMSEARTNCWRICVTAGVHSLRHERSRIVPAMASRMRRVRR